MTFEHSKREFEARASTTWMNSTRLPPDMPGPMHDVDTVVTVIQVVDAICGSAAQVVTLSHHADSVSLERPETRPWPPRTERCESRGDRMPVQRQERGMPGSG